MMTIKTNSWHKYLCGLKIGTIFIMIAILYDTKNIQWFVMLLVGTGVVFLDKRYIYEIDNLQMAVYKEDILDKNKVTTIDLKHITDVTLTYPAFQCLSRISIECQRKRCFVLYGYDFTKKDFDALLSKLKQHGSFHVKMV